MEPEKISNIHRKFGYAAVTWEIENFFSATCKKDWVIRSPDYSVSGRQTTKWRLFLKSKRVKGNYTVHTYLERLETDPFPDAVRVKWKLSYLMGETEHEVSEVTSVYEKNTAIKMQISAIEMLENHIRSNISNTFLVRCRMIVYDKDGIRNDIPSDFGLKCLSQDLAVLCRLGRWSDVTIFAGQTIYAHKGIVSVRNNVLKFRISKYCDIVEMDYEWIKQDIVADLMAFFYTGNLDYVLRTPSLKMHRLISHLKVNELKNYFTQDELFLRTTIGTKDFNFEWIIPNVSSVEDDCILSPLWRIEILNTTFQLCLYLKEFDDGDYVAMFGEFVNGEKPTEAYLECVVTSKNGQLLEQKHLAWSSEGTQKLGFEKFISRDVLKDSAFLNQGVPRITCKLRIPTGTQSNSITSSKICSLVTTKKDQHYENLSKDMGILFESGKYSDFTISSRVISYKVHKAILMSRSHVLAKLIRDVKDDTSLSFPDIDAYTLRTVLRYLYTGILKNDEIRDITKIYSAAERFCILPLKYTCSQILQGNLKIENVLEILILAHKSKDLKLKLSAFKFFCSKVNEIQHREGWCNYVDENPLLKKEFFNFTKTFISLRYREKLEESGILRTDDVIKRLNLSKDYS